MGDAAALADELTEALLSVSANVSTLRKRLPATDVFARDMRALDDAFGRAVALARRLTLAIREQSDPGAFADVARIARDLARHLVPVMPEGVALTVTCAPSPTLAAMAPSEVRRVLSLLFRRVIEGLAERRGDLTLEVGEQRTHTAGPTEVRVQLAHRALRLGAAADAAEDVRPSVNASGGSVEPCAQTGGGAAVLVLLPAVG
ncbi:MAG TPA: hypothetical protein VHV30_14690 [Polyangiaceae bacterium]|nr:hypothetical protein [Polyangiaceae bacterium]